MSEKDGKAKLRQAGSYFSVCAGYLVAWTVGAAVYGALGELARSYCGLDCSGRELLWLVRAARLVWD